MPRTHKQDLADDHVLVLDFFKSVRCHGSDLALLANGAVQQHFSALISGEKKLSLQEALDLLPNLLSYISGVLTDDFSDDVPAINQLEFSLDYDEAHFWLNGYVNKQNCRIWNEANPQVYVETPLHPEKLTVWCALWAGGIIGPYFFKNDESHNVTVHGDRYRAMITNFFIPELNNHDVQELWFQQASEHHDCSMSHSLCHNRFIERHSLVYADKPQTLDHLEDNIRRVIADIRRQMLEKFIENWTSRLDYIRASRGSPMPEIIFEMRSPQNVYAVHQSIAIDLMLTPGLEEYCTILYGDIGKATLLTILLWRACLATLCLCRHDYMDIVALETPKSWDVSAKWAPTI
ncbi:putative DD41D transposase [Trichonephila clavipes]|nr:putative DD41D transposase [Trichonephila clavipes]